MMTLGSPLTLLLLKLQNVAGYSDYFDFTFDNCCSVITLLKLLINARARKKWFLSLSLILNISLLNLLFLCSKDLLFIMWYIIGRIIFQNTICNYQVSFSKNVHSNWDW